MTGQAVIVSARRSPIGRARKGSLTGLRADDMLAQISRAVLDDVPGLDPNDIEDFYVGCGLPGGEQGYNLARATAVSLGLDNVPGATVTRYCASSVQSLRMAYHGIAAGEGDAFLVGGVEAVSRFDKGSSDDLPDTRNSIYLDAMARSLKRSQPGAGQWTDPRLAGQLPDIHIAMGQTAENVARLYGISRQEQDEFALRSQSLAADGIRSGFFATEITPLTLGDGSVASSDDCPRPGTTMEQLSALAPVFREDGTVTAGNACPLNDGAAALLVMSAAKAKELRLEPLARIMATGVSALSPEIMGLGPVESTRRALDRAGLTVADLDQVEINEAFAAQVIASQRVLGIELDKLNPRGGAIALGHPYGMTGARLVVTLLNSLRASDGQLGAVTMCVAGGQGMSLILERLT